MAEYDQDVFAALNNFDLDTWEDDLASPNEELSTPEEEPRDLTDAISSFDMSTWEDEAPSFSRPDPEPEERGYVEAIGTGVADMGRAAAGSVNSLIGIGGEVYALATGDKKNWATHQGEIGREYWEEGKSEHLKQLEAQRAKRVAEADGEFAKAGVAAWETLSSASLLSAFVAEQGIYLLPIAGAGRTAALGAKAAGLSKKAQGAAGTAGAVATGMPMTGADASKDAYDELMRLDQKLWDVNPDYKMLTDDGVDPEVAKHQISIGIARKSFSAAAVVSGITNAVFPWGRILERKLAGGAGKTGDGLLKGAAKGVVGEGLQESVEEWFTKVAANMGLGVIDPDQDPFEGSGEAGGLGGLGGALFGGAAGLVSGAEAPAEGANQVETTLLDGTKATVSANGRIYTEDAVDNKEPPPPPGASPAENAENYSDETELAAIADKGMDPNLTADEAAAQALAATNASGQSLASAQAAGADSAATQAESEAQAKTTQKMQKEAEKAQKADKDETIIVKLGNKTLTYTAGPHTNPELAAKGEMIFSVSGVDEAGERIFDQRYDKNYKDEKTFRAAIKRQQKNARKEEAAKAKSEEAPVEEAATDESIFVTDTPSEEGLQHPKHEALTEEDYRESKGIEVEIVEMTPQEYLDRSAEILNGQEEFEVTPESLRTTREAEGEYLGEMKDAMEAGTKFTAPYLDYNFDQQEGNRRAIAAEQMGMEKIPVVVINKKGQDQGGTKGMAAPQAKAAPVKAKTEKPKAETAQAKTEKKAEPAATEQAEDSTSKLRKFFEKYRRDTMNPDDPNREQSIKTVVDGDMKEALRGVEDAKAGKKKQENQSGPYLHGYDSVGQEATEEQVEEAPTRAKDLKEIGKLTYINRNGKKTTVPIMQRDGGKLLVKVGKNLKSWTVAANGDVRPLGRNNVFGTEGVDDGAVERQMTPDSDTTEQTEEAEEQKAEPAEDEVTEDPYEYDEDGDYYGDEETTGLADDTPSTDQAPLREGGITKDQANIAIAGTLNAWKESGMIVKVIGSNELGKYGIEQQKGKIVKGFIQGKNIYIVHDNLKNSRDTQVQLAHEAIGHFGINNIVADWNAMWNGYQQMKSKGGRRFNSIHEELTRRYGKELSPGTEVKEFLAIAAERREKAGAIGRYYRDSVNKIIAGLKKMRVINPRGPFSMTEIDTILQKSEDSLTREGTEGTEGTQLSEDDDGLTPEERARMEAIEAEHTLTYEPVKNATPKARARISRSLHTSIAIVAEQSGISRKLLTDAVANKIAPFAAKDGWARVNELHKASRNKKGEIAIEFKKQSYTYQNGKDPQKLATKMVAEVKALQARTDRNSRVIKRQQRWYSGMRTSLRAVFGGASDASADFLGALSPNTAAPSNFEEMLLVLEMMSDKDPKIMGALADYQMYLDEGGSQKEEDYKAFNGMQPTRPNGKGFGTWAKQKGVMDGLLNLFRQFKREGAPKAKTFAQNLIGALNDATIDVWAARMLQRLAGEKRVPTIVERGVTGEIKKDLTPGGQFRFGQDVFKLAADELEMEPHELQALAWFMEKELWGDPKNDWTTKVGAAGGSFEGELAKAHLGRWMSGLSVQKKNKVRDKKMFTVARRLVDSLGAMTGVKIFRAADSVGEYDGDYERAFDLEVTASKTDFDERSFIQEVAQISKENDQWDTFVSRIMGPEEESDNARPGFEVYFKQDLDQVDAEKIVDIARDAGIKGFTLIVDPRADARGDKDRFIGFRHQHIPEFSARWSEDFQAEMSTPEAIEAEYTKAEEALDDIVDVLEQEESVAYTSTYKYDTLVIGIENYDQFTKSSTRGGDKAAGEIRFPSSRTESLQEAIGRYQSRPGQKLTGRDALSGRDEDTEPQDLDAQLSQEVAEEYQQAVDKGLPMDMVSRMKRAVSMGMDPDNPWFRGQRADRNMDTHPGILFFSHETTVAEDFSRVPPPNSQMAKPDDAPAITKVLINTDDVFDTNNEEHNEDLLLRLEDHLKGLAYDDPAKDAAEIVEGIVQSNALFSDIEDPIVIDTLMESGYSGFYVHEGYYHPDEDNPQFDERNVGMFGTGEVRAATAAFDPDFKGKPNISLSQDNDPNAAFNERVESLSFLPNADVQTILEATSKSNDPDRLEKAQTALMGGWSMKELGEYHDTVRAPEEKAFKNDPQAMIEFLRTGDLTGYPAIEMGSISEPGTGPSIDKRRIATWIATKRRQAGDGKPAAGKDLLEQRGNESAALAEHANEYLATLINKYWKVDNVRQFPSQLSQDTDTQDKEGFFSGLSRAVSNMKQGKGPAKQMFETLKKMPGVKQDEIKALDLEEFIEAHEGKLTKEQLQEYVDANGVQVETKTLGKVKALTARETARWQELADKEGVDPLGPRPPLNESSLTDEEFDEMSDFEWKQNKFGKDETEYSSHLLNLPGGDNYREILFTLPSRQESETDYFEVEGAFPADFSTREEAEAHVDQYESLTRRWGLFDDGNIIEAYATQEEAEQAWTEQYDPDNDNQNLHVGERPAGDVITQRLEAYPLSINKVDKVKKGTEDYTGSHFPDSPNLLLHLRVNDRTSARREKILFLEEIQSDWWAAENDANKADARWDEEGMMSSDEHFARENRPSPTPFKNNSWVELGMKKALRMAAEGGYDSVAWTTGNTQADRYNLRQNITSVTYEKVGHFGVTLDGKVKKIYATREVAEQERDFMIEENDDLDLDIAPVDRYKISATGKGAISSAMAIDDTYTAEELNKVVGKELAQRIVNDEGQKNPPNSIESSASRIKGLDLDVGGEGMISFYDKTVPNLMKTVGRKLDKKARVEWDGMGVPTELGMVGIHKIQITDKMREGAMGGQPLFSQDDAPVNDGFFSGLSRAVSSMKQTKGPARQMFNTLKGLPGVKQAEIEALDLEEFIDAHKGKLSLEELQAYVDNNGIQIETTRLGEISEEERHERAMEKVAERTEFRVRARTGKVYAVDKATEETLGDDYGEDRYWEEEEDALDELAREYIEHTGVALTTAHYGKGSLIVPGGENYREILLSLPERGTTMPEGYTAEEIPDNDKGWWKVTTPTGREMSALNERRALVRANIDAGVPRNYESGHYGREKPNVIMHMRVDDRTTSNGERILFIEEIQSDWHQKGKDSGYKETVTEKTRERKKKTALDLRNKLKEENNWGYDTTFQAMRFIRENEEYDSKKDATPETIALAKEHKKMHDAAWTYAPPDGPFKGNDWVALGLKKALRMAAEGGYDQVAWTDGQTQADRYRLEEHVEKIAYQKNDDGTYKVFVTRKGAGPDAAALDRVGGQDMSSVPEKKMAGIFGKELTEKIVNGEQDKQWGQIKVLSGLDLNVGGKGMKNFYDRLVPNLMKDAARKLDKKARLGTTSIQTREAEAPTGPPSVDSIIDWREPPETALEVQTIPITDKMRQKAMEGQTLFSQENAPETEKPVSPVMGGIQKAISEMKLPQWAAGKSARGREILRKISRLPGIKKGELESVGLDDILSPDQRYSREEVMSSLGMGDTQFSEDEDSRYTPEQDEAITHGGGRTQGPPTVATQVKESIQSMVETFKDLSGVKEMASHGAKVFRQGMVDQYASFNSVLKSDKTWKMANMTNSAVGAMQVLMGTAHKGKVIGAGLIMEDGAIGIKEGSKSFQELAAPLKGELLNKWLWWQIGHRAEKLKGQTNEDGTSKEKHFTDQQIAALKTLNKGNEQMFEDVRKDFEELQNSVYDMAIESGLIDKKQAMEWRNDGFYVPFYRVLMEEANVAGPRMIGGSDAGLIRQKAFKELTGRDSALKDPLANVMSNWHHLISATLKNNAANAALNSAQNMVTTNGVPLAKKINRKGRGSKSIFTMVNGQEQWWNIDESPEGKLVLDSLTALNWNGLNNGVMKTTRAFKRALTFGVTLSPEFKIANLLRDSIQAMAVANMSVNPAKNIYQGWQATDKEGKTYLEMLAGGGIFGDAGYVHGGDKDAIDRLMSNGVGRDNILDSRNKIKNMLRKLVATPYNKYQDLGVRGENVNRAANYVQSTGNRLDRNFEARDHLAFDRTGSSWAIRYLSQTVPFLNARLQGLDKNYRAAVDPNQKKQWIGVTTAYAAASVVMYLSMKDDEDYKEREQWERDAYHLFKIPGDPTGTLWALPRPFEVGAFATIAERVVEQFADDEANLSLLGERLGHVLLDTFAFNPVPQIAKPYAEVMTNTNWYTGRRIESLGMDLQNLPATSRKRPWTSPTAIKASEAMGAVMHEKLTFSPVQIEHLTRGYLGWLGASAIGLADTVITRPLTDAPTAPSMTWRDYPIIKRFAKDPNPNNTKYTSLFYERGDEISMVAGAIRQARENQEWDKAERLMKKNNDIMGLEDYYNKQRLELGKLNRRMKIIHSSTKKSGPKKTQELSLIKIRKAKLTKIIHDATKDNF